MTINKTVHLFFVGFFLFLSCDIALAAFDSKLHGYALGAWGFTRTKGDQNVWLAHTPAPGLENYYAGARRQNDTHLIGVGIEKKFLSQAMPQDSSFGLEMNYLKNSSIKGVVYPMINIDPDIDRLDYSYDLDSYSFFVTGKLQTSLQLPHFGIYLHGGIGGAVNRLKNYEERIILSTGPMLQAFHDGHNANFATFIGAGIAYEFPAVQFSLGYRFMYTGSAKFKPSPVQQTHHALDFSPLTHQFLVLSLMV